MEQLENPKILVSKEYVELVHKLSYNLVRIGAGNSEYLKLADKVRKTSLECLEGTK
jgi:hypothetical protein